MVRANALIVFPEFETELAEGSQVRVVLLEEAAALGQHLVPDALAAGRGRTGHAPA
jgi:hypothetical protein